MNRLPAILFSVWFYLLLLVYTAAAVPVLVLAVAVTAPFSTRRARLRRIRRAIALYGRGIVRVLPFPFVRIRYRAPAGPPTPGRLFVANHPAASDAFLLALLPEEMVAVVNRWPFRIPVWGHFARQAGCLDVLNLTPDAFQARGRALLAEGVCITGFPEGTRSGSRTVAPFHSALFRLALDARAAIVPFCIAGNERTPVRGSFVLEPALIRMTRLPELTWESFRHLTPFQLKNHVRDILQNHLNAREEPAS